MTVPPPPPQAKLIQRWDVATISALLFTALVTPVEVSFIEASSLDVLFFINRVVDLIFIVVCVCVDVSVCAYDCEYGCVRMHYVCVEVVCGG